jgi:hypothetical protein
MERDGKCKVQVGEKCTFFEECVLPLASKEVKDAYSDRARKVL